MLLLLLMTLLGAFGGFFLKKASALSFSKMFKCKYLYIGGCAYGCAALMNIVLLQKMEYSIVLPLTSLTYIWTMILAYLFLKERFSVPKICGVMCIIAGAAFLSFAAV